MRCCCPSNLAAPRLNGSSAALRNCALQHAGSADCPSACASHHPSDLDSTVHHDCHSRSPPTTTWATLRRFIWLAPGYMWCACKHLHRLYASEAALSMFQAAYNGLGNLAEIDSLAPTDASSRALGVRWQSGNNAMLGCSGCCCVSRRAYTLCIPCSATWRLHQMSRPELTYTAWSCAVGPPIVYWRRLLTCFLNSLRSNSPKPYILNL